jgi:hypothetical protein
MNMQTIVNALNSLTLYRNILHDPVVRAYMDHLAALANPGGPAHPAHTYGKLYHLLAQTANPTTGADAWQNHLLDLILDDVNPFSLAAYSSNIDFTVFMPAVERDLAILRLVFENGAEAVLEATTRELPRHPPLPGHLARLPLQAAPPPAGEQSAAWLEVRVRFKEEMAAAPRWDKLAGPLAAHYAEFGCGLFGRHIAFKWQNGSLCGVSRPDPVTLDELIGYQDVRWEIIHNTLQFLHGLPANNILLYGDRGTGKSSTVKALLNEYWPRGLRLLEVPKQQLVEFPHIIKELRHRRHRFILFVDDLSFEENETGYKDLKALLEGGLETRPANVLIYATSNRRHLIRENFADREPVATGGEVHGMDSVQEKLSLSDRFGITIIFPTPDQELFLNIVAGLAGRRNLSISSEDLRRRALQWSAWHNGHSPRSARQFIDHLEGELALEKLNP